MKTNYVYTAVIGFMLLVISGCGSLPGVNDTATLNSFDLMSRFEISVEKNRHKADSERYIEITNVKKGISAQTASLRSNSLMLDDIVLFCEKGKEPYRTFLWSILRQNSMIRSEVQPATVVFVRRNPVKYLVRVPATQEGFWLVFLQAFHTQWRIYPAEKNEIIIFQNIGKNSPENNQRAEFFAPEAFTLKDAGFLFRKSLIAPHKTANGFANAWHLEASKKDRIFVIYFWPQSLLCLGVVISALIIACMVFYIFIRRKSS